MKYVALLRGIAPLNPNMQNDKLRGVAESLGLRHVETVISSGNVLFETDRKDTSALEADFEKAWPARLGFASTTIIRSQDQIRALVDKNVFKAYADAQSSRLNVTFLKKPPSVKLTFPYRPENKPYELLGDYDGAIGSVVDLTVTGTPDLMTWLERQFGKEITTRTWKTVGRILNRLDAMP